MPGEAAKRLQLGGREPGAGDANKPLRIDGDVADLGEGEDAGLQPGIDTGTGTGTGTLMSTLVGWNENHSKTNSGPMTQVSKNTAAFAISSRLTQGVN